MPDHDWKKIVNSYPEDLYDDDDYIVEKRQSELRKTMYSHIVMGVGIGVMLTIGLATTIAYFLPPL